VGDSPRVPSWVLLSASCMLLVVSLMHTAAVRPTGLRSTQLRHVRLAAGLKQSQLLLRLEQAGRQLGVEVAPRPSLKRQVSRWENGAPMSADYRRLFCQIYDKIEAELGFQETALSAMNDDLTVTPSGLVIPPPALGAGALDYLRRVLVEYMRADNLLGPHHLKSIVTGHLDLVSQLLRTTRGADRIQLLEIAARFAEFAGWLHQDAGDLTAAAHWSVQAGDYAHELNDPHLTAYVFMRRSNIATDIEDPGSAIGLAEAALRQRDRLTPGLRAVALRQHAHAAALWNDRDDCARAIDAATTELVSADPGREESDLAAYCTPAYIAMETASCWVHLGEPERAIPIYERSLIDWPTGLERDRGLCLSRLAAAHATAGNQAEAIEVTSRASMAVRAAHSARAAKQLGAVRSTLAARSSAKVVANVDQVLTGLI
jgi:tetratricopeptide (TPR) repeat protein